MSTVCRRMPETARRTCRREPRTRSRATRWARLTRKVPTPDRPRAGPTRRIRTGSSPACGTRRSRRPTRTGTKLPDLRRARPSMRPTGTRRDEQKHNGGRDRGLGRGHPSNTSDADKVGSYASLGEAVQAAAALESTAKLVYVRSDYTLEEDVVLPYWGHALRLRRRVFRRRSRCRPDRSGGQDALGGSDQQEPERDEKLDACGRRRRHGPARGRKLQGKCAIRLRIRAARRGPDRHVVRSCRKGALQRREQVLLRGRPKRHRGAGVQRRRARKGLRAFVARELRFPEWRHPHAAGRPKRSLSGRRCERRDDRSRRQGAFGKDGQDFRRHHGIGHQSEREAGDHQGCGQERSGHRDLGWSQRHRRV